MQVRPSSELLLFCSSVREIFLKKVNLFSDVSACFAHAREDDESLCDMLRFHQDMWLFTLSADFLTALDSGAIWTTLARWSRARRRTAIFATVESCIRG